LNDVLVRGSAEASAILLKLSGTPFYREGPVFQLPGIAIQVAEECSGIHSTLVLFITSLLAGNLFLRSSWSRAVLAAAVLPVGILRNGLRICTIALLSVHLGPEMIDSPIHRRGGPVFFVLSLFLLGILVALLRWVERRGGDVNTKKHGDK
jgi:exosortase